MRLLLALTSAISTSGLPLSLYFFSRSRVGNLYLRNGSRGLMGVRGMLSELTTLPLAASSSLLTSTVSLPATSGAGSSMIFIEFVSPVESWMTVEGMVGSGVFRGSAGSFALPVSSSSMPFSSSSESWPLFSRFVMVNFTFEVMYFTGLSDLRMSSMV